MATPTFTTPAGLQELLRLQLRPHEHMHPSWLPPTWPGRWRRWQSLGPAGRTVPAISQRRSEGRTLALEPGENMIGSAVTAALLLASSDARPAAPDRAGA